VSGGQKYLETLQGRIIALELIATTYLAGLALMHSDPPALVDRMRREMFDSLQFAERPIDEASERIWAEAIAALNRRFDQAKQRVAHHARG
jgi:hypothetical protein